MIQYRDPGPGLGVVGKDVFVVGFDTAEERAEGVFGCVQRFGNGDEVPALGERDRRERYIFIFQPHGKERESGTFGIQKISDALPIGIDNGSVSGCCPAGKVMLFFDEGIGAQVLRCVIGECLICHASGAAVCIIFDGVCYFLPRFSHNDTGIWGVVIRSVNKQGSCMFIRYIDHTAGFQGTIPTRAKGIFPDMR